MKKNKDIHKKDRDELDSTLEQKFMNNLQWSMIFFCFNHTASMIAEANDIEDKLYVQKQFIKSWKNFVHLNITKSDLKIINDILSSPKNVFNSALQNPDEVSESTEIYQEKYDSILNNIEIFFLQTVKSNYNDSEDQEE